MGRHSAPSRFRRTRSRSTGQSDGRPRRSVRVSDRADVARGADLLRERPRQSRGRRIVLGIGLGVLALVLGVVAYGYFFYASVDDAIRASDDVEQGVAEVLTGATPEEPFTVLFIGVDSLGAAGDSRADTLILAQIDPELKRVWMISIPRDTKADIPGYGTAKINKAYQEGGVPLTIQTVEQTVGISINHYAEIDISGFKAVVDSLGGVWVDVDVEIDDPKAAAANKGRAGQHIDPGYQLLDGNHAIVYVRSRDFPDADFTRMRHQQEFFKALAKQALAAENIFKLPATAKTAAGYVMTDMSLGDVVDALLSLKGMDTNALETTTLRGEWISPYVYTDEEYKKQIISRMQAGLPFDGASTPAGVVLPPDVTVDVRNGMGNSGVADEASALLQAAGFDVQNVGNAKQFDYGETVIVYSDLKDAAQAVADTLGTGRLIQDDGTWLRETDVLVVIGGDWPDRVPSSE